MEVLFIIGISLLTALVSLSGGFLLLTESKFATLLRKVGPYVAVIVMIYAIVADLWPEATSEVPILQVAAIALGCLVLFLGLGALAGKAHTHGDDVAFLHKRQSIMMILVDGLHALADGLVLGIAFSASPGTGILAATATAAHEIPQEIGDFAILLRSKMPKKRVALIQTLTALILVPATVGAYFLGDALLSIHPYLIAVIIGFFLYIILGEIISIVKSFKSR